MHRLKSFRTDKSACANCVRALHLAGVLLVTSVWTILFARVLLADQPAPQRLVAIVNREKISKTELDAAIAAVTARNAKVTNLPELQAGVLARLIDQRLAAQNLRDEKWAATKSDIDNQVADLEAQLKQQSLTLADYLTQKQCDEQELRRRLEWDRNWSTFLARSITDETLQDTFEQNAADYDGRQGHVRQILLTQTPLKETTLSDLRRKASEVLREINSGKLTFPEAASRYSQAASARNEGDLGFIPRYGEMSESFSRAAFALEPGEVSAPVLSPFGIHLIQCVEIRAGDKQWTDIRETLRDKLSEQLFQQLAAETRATADIKIAPDVPHFRVGTQELIVPKPRKPAATARR